ncbi:hypothetical protein SLEP1_g24519 [Rubroshorea leprosula]|uniref:Uncharacterized protein n=1 Tax=Rubroshorea leprosula TaxID=152421 RepID=A0AAV5JG74_9ROSI|nr:hypothetical protein SLEP1_g24519 [Rubroshorea leprosula]
MHILQKKAFRSLYSSSSSNICHEEPREKCKKLQL